MTDRYHSLTVVLEKDVRTDDAEPIINAIRMVKGVLSVSGKVSNIESHVAQERARFELGKEILEVVYPKISLDSSSTVD